MAHDCDYSFYRVRFVSSQRWDDRRFIKRLHCKYNYSGSKYCALLTPNSGFFCLAQENGFRSYISAKHATPSETEKSPPPLTLDANGYLKMDRSQAGSSRREYCCSGN